MIMTNICDTSNGVCQGTTPGVQEGPSGASQPDPNSEQGLVPAVCVPAILRVWSRDGQLLGSCQIETYAKGDGSHFFVVPAHINLDPGFRVEIEVER